jgi:SIR2-like domain
MSFKIDELNVSNSGFGLLLGAGASFEAGYPLMSTLTTMVLNSLNGDQRDLIADLVYEETGSLLDIQKGEPNIELISDLVTSRAIKLGRIDGDIYFALIDSIRDSIVSVLRGVRDPDLSYHIRLLDALKRIKGSNSSPIWIFTTNYDLLIERAAAEVGIPLYDGFLGSSVRYFNSSSLYWSHGNITNYNGIPKFEVHTGPYINLVKLHGSIDWWIATRDDVTDKVFSCLDDKYISGKVKRAMIMPQRSKVQEVMGSPYDQLWNVVNQVLGTSCKYLIANGFSFGDDHINTKLLIPKLVNGRIKIIALLEKETPGLNSLAQYSAFCYCTKNIRSDGGKKSCVDSDLWKFSSFVNLIASYAGI